jgi:thymidylate synthase ThyX
MFQDERNGRRVVLIDDQHPEDLAMLQALYSRSGESVVDHLAKVKKTGSGKFMERFYVGYGHKSIADCGTTTLFFEGVSMLAAKAIQDWPLYCGQESSTRYLDFGSRPVEDPFQTGDHSEESQAIIGRWLSFYRNAGERVSEEVMRRYPQHADEKDSAYKGAVKARTFDILRGFLPAGCTTQLSWHTNLRQAGDHLIGLQRHPLVEIRQLARQARSLLSERYKGTAGAFGQVNRREADAWQSKLAKDFSYDQLADTGHLFSSNIDRASINNYAGLINSRPARCVLPHWMTDFGSCYWTPQLDFGSFRDIQRHRNGVCRMPLLTTKLGFHEWYLEQLDESLLREAKDLIAAQEDALAKFDPVQAQYLVAMGYKVQLQLTYALPALLYVFELRSSKAVHPTLRAIVQQAIKQFRKLHPEVKMHVDEDPSSWDVRRGTQTIKEKS